jgi:hypothetical protein
MALKMNRWLPLLAMLFTTAAGCAEKKVEAREEDDDDSSEDSRPVEKTSDASVITEKQGDVAVSWAVTPSGDVSVRATDKGADVKPEDIDGALAVTKLGGKPEDFKLKAKEGRNMVNVGELDSPITEVRYSLTVKGKPAAGVLHVPKAGTKLIVDGATAAAAKTKIKPGAKGPHGGVVQVVDDDIVEVVGKKGSGNVRVYPLDEDLKPVKIEKQKVKLALVADEPQVVELEADPTNAYFSGDFTIKTDPSRITVYVEEDDDIDCAIVGYEPAEVLIIGPGAPVVVVYVVDSWDVVVVQPRWHGKGKGKGKWKKGRGHGRGVHVHVH